MVETSKYLWYFKLLLICRYFLPVNTRQYLPLSVILLLFTGEKIDKKPARYDI